LSIEKCEETAAWNNFVMSNISYGSLFFHFYASLLPKTTGRSVKIVEESEIIYVQKPF